MSHDERFLPANPAELTDAELEAVVGGKQPTPAAPAQKPSIFDKIRARLESEKAGKP